jgi:hypothetical protein
VIHAEERGTPKNRKKIHWKLITDLSADSDEVAQAFRFDGAQDSDMMSPRASDLAGW